MSTKNSIRSILLYSFCMILVIGMMAIDSHIHPVAENVRWPGVLIGSIATLGILTCSALEKMEKRISGLEEKLEKKD